MSKISVIIEEVSVNDLQTKIQEAKDAGRRILDVAPAVLTKIGGVRSKETRVVSYHLITQ